MMHIKCWGGDGGGGGCRGVEGTPQECPLLASYQNRNDVAMKLHSKSLGRFEIALERAANSPL